MNRLAIDARGVRLSLGGRPVLDDVSLAVPYGEVHALLGPNGAGKSTLLSVLSGDMDAEGEVELAERPLPSWSTAELARERSVLLQQNPVLFPFTARQVVAMGRSPWRGRPEGAHDDEAVERAMEQTDVAHLADRPVPRLSGGERARVALARILAQSTGILMLDEPTAALDLKHQEDVLRIARARAAEGAAVVVVMHDLNTAAALADRMTLLGQGRVAATGVPEEVLTPESIRAVYHQEVELVPHPRGGAPLIVPVR